MSSNKSMLILQLQTEVEMIRALCEREEILRYLKLKRFPLDLPEEIEYIKKSMLKEAYDWLMELSHMEVTGIRRVRELRTEEQWDYVNMMPEDFEDHTEVKLLKEAVKLLKKKLTSKDRPDLFKKGKVNAIIRKIKKAIEKDGKTSQESPRKTRKKKS